MVVLVGPKAGGLKELEAIGLAPNWFRLETVGRNVELDKITGVEGKEVVCVTGGGDIVGVATYDTRKGSIHLSIHKENKRLQVLH